jgi:hypothetical protein
MSEQVISSAVAQCIVDKFLTSKNVKPAEIQANLRTDSMMMLCEDCTLFVESYGQPFFGGDSQIVSCIDFLI